MWVFSKERLKSFAHLWTILSKCTTVPQVRLYNNRTIKYTPVPRGEPSSHGITVKCRIP